MSVTKFQKIGTLTRAGETKKVAFTATYREIAERFNFERLLNRRDFDVESEQAGNRDITEAHWKKIADGLRTNDRPFVGTITVAMPEDQFNIETHSRIGDGAELVTVTVYEDAENPLTEDGQHRVTAILDVWRQVKDSDHPADVTTRERFERSSATIEMLLEDDADQLSAIFLRMASTKPISASLIAVMDRSTFQNKLGAYVMKHSRLFQNRTSYLSTRASKALADAKGRTFEELYPAVAVRNAAASLAGVGLRDRTRSSGRRSSSRS